jgi:hypothetical protein
MSDRIFHPGSDIKEACHNANNLMGKRDSYKIQNHTYLKRRDSATIAVMFWATDVVTYNQDGSVCLDTGGYRSMSTRERMNAYNPLGSVVIERGDWWYYNSSLLNNSWAMFYEFKSGMIIQSDGTPDTRRREIVLLERMFDKDLTNAQAAEYVAGLELKQIKGLVRNKYLRAFALEHCKKELVPAFLTHEDLVDVIERRLKENE